MVLLTTVAMQSSRPTHLSIPSHHHSSLPTSPMDAHTERPVFSLGGPSFSYTRYPKARRNSGPVLGVTERRSSSRSPVMSPGVYSSLTNLDVWSPNTVSVSSLLRHSVSKPTRNGFDSVKGNFDKELYNMNESNIRNSYSKDSYSINSDTDCRNFSATSSYVHTAQNHSNMVKSRTLRRTMSADPSSRPRREVNYHNSALQEAPARPDPGMPRVCSDGDLLETEQNSMDSGYSSAHTKRESRIDSMYRQISDTSPLHSSSSFSDFGMYRRHYSDDSDYSYASSGYSSGGSVSGRNVCGSMGSLQHSGTERGIMRRATSVDREWGQTTPMERGRALPRRMSCQVLQTVVENTPPTPKPTKSILKNGNKNNNHKRDSSTGAGGSFYIPSSTCSSRRSSLASRTGVNLSQDSLLSDEPTSLEIKTPDSPSPPTPVSPKPSAKQTALNRGANNRTRIKRLSLRHRSKSLSDLTRDNDSEQASTARYSDDEDGDDFGFLSHPVHAATLSSSVHAATVSLSSSPVSKARTTTSSSSSSSSGSSQRFLARRWRGKNKTSSSVSAAQNAQTIWSSEGPCTWCSVSGRQVVLKDVSILGLSEAERLALQKLSSARLQAMDMACPIVIPKDSSREWGRHRKRALSLKRKCKSANLASLLDTLASDKGKDKENKGGGMTFGIPLSRVIVNDRQMPVKREATPVVSLHKRSGSDDPLLSGDRKSSSSSQGSLDNGVHNGSSSTSGSVADSARRAASTDSLSEWDDSNLPGGSSLIEALSLSAPTTDTGQALPTGPQVPRVVKACFQHLETYGLNVVGIFRVGSSKKRVKQLREEFDSGHEVKLTQEHNVHDVGALLKEFFRDLPEPLLTRDLYQPFVATRKIKEREKQAEAMRLLLTLLPVANRDTLWALLLFLHLVHQHCNDTVDEQGQEIPGNKMDSQNLATLFGPNVLHCLRAVNEKQLLAECAEQAEQSSEVIAVVKDLIDNHRDLFQISANQHDDILKLMLEADKENLDIVLRRLSNENTADTDTQGESEGQSERSGSLTHSSNSDADLLSLVGRRSVGEHQTLRVSRSADPWTDCPENNDDQPPEEVYNEDSTPEQSPRHRDRRSRPVSSPNYPDTVDSPALIRASSDRRREDDKSDSPVLLRASTGRRRDDDSGSATSTTRPLSDLAARRQRPYSDTYSGHLTVPRLVYGRESSTTSTDISNSRQYSPGRTSPEVGSLLVTPYGSTPLLPPNTGW